MSYEEIMSLKPKSNYINLLIDLDSISIFVWVMLIISMFIIVLLLNIGLFNFVSTPHKYITTILIIIGIILTAVLTIYMSTKLIQKKHELNIVNWENQYIIPYIKEQEKITELIDSFEMIAANEAKVVIGSESINAKLKYDDVEEPIFTYYVLKENFTDYYKEGFIYFPELTVPRDYFNK